jgi:hypothetical protein
MMVDTYSALMIEIGHEPIPEDLITGNTLQTFNNIEGYLHETGLGRKIFDNYLERMAGMLAIVHSAGYFGNTEGHSSNSPFTPRNNSTRSFYDWDTLTPIAGYLKNNQPEASVTESNSEKIVSFLISDLMDCFESLAIMARVCRMDLTSGGNQIVRKFLHNYLHNLRIINRKLDYFYAGSFGTEKNEGKALLLLLSNVTKAIIGDEAEEENDLLKAYSNFFKLEQQF